MPVFKLPKFDRHTHIAINNDIVPNPELALANSDPLLLARNAVEGASVVHKFGGSTSVGTAFVPLTTSQTYQTPMVAEAVEVLSDDTNDNGTTSPLGSGALSVQIHGIRDWAVGQEIEEVTLNGTTAVAVPGTWLRIYRVKVSVSGSYASSTAVSHDSTITVQGAGGGVVWAQVASLDGIGLAQSEVAVYSIGAGEIAFMQHAEVWIESTKSANIIFFVRENADVITAPYSARQSKIIMRSVIDAVHVDPNTPYGPFIGPCDMGWMGEATLGSASIGVDYEIIKFDV